jgi:hypothetical protein
MTRAFADDDERDYPDPPDPDDPAEQGRRGERDRPLDDEEPDEAAGQSER